MEQKTLILQIDVTWQPKVETAEHLFLKQICTGSRTGKITEPADEETADNDASALE
jgi:hypothetical protein